MQPISHLAALAAWAIVIGGTVFAQEPTMPTTDPSQHWPKSDALPKLTDLPDPLVDPSGHRIDSPEQWSKQREWIKLLIQHYAIGTIPPAPGNVTGDVLKTGTVLEGKAKYQLVRLHFGPDRTLGFELAIYTPTDGAGPYPTIVHPSFGDTPGGTPASRTSRAPSTKYTADYPATPDKAAQAFAESLSRGYAIAAYDYRQCGDDRNNNRDTGFFPAYPGYDWGTLAAWAWGLSRAVDYLESQDFVDKQRIIAVGHSRLGKTVLIAGAFDDRIALTVPAGSGCGGTGSYRVNGKLRGGKEGLEEITAHFPYWFGPHLVDFTGQVEKLPFDEHWLIALCAPRPLLSTEAFDDGACNGNASVKSYLAAEKVYEFLGAPSRLGLHFRPGKHALTPDDWHTILNFSDRELRGKTVDQRFDEVPDASLLH